MDMLGYKTSLSILQKAAAATAKSLQSCPTLCDPIAGSRRCTPFQAHLSPCAHRERSRHAGSTLN